MDKERFLLKKTYNLSNPCHPCSIENYYHMLDASRHERYSRHILLPEIGEAGQQKLLAAKVLVIGAGGLGSPILQYLTAAGVGTIGIADDDVVSLSNLQRQILYTIDDLRKPKAVVAAAKLKLLNGDVLFKVIDTRITNANAWDSLNGYDIIIDGSDNFSTRYLVNDASVLLSKPLVYGSIFRFEGQVAVFNFNGSTNYRNVFPDPPGRGEVPDCAEAGVLGVLPGIIGSLMANEAIKLITGIGKPLVNSLLTYNALYNSFYEIALEKDTKTAALMPKNRTAFEDFSYELSCDLDDVQEIQPEEFSELVGRATIIDVREYGERPLINDFEHLHIPLTELRQKQTVFTNEPLVFFCQSGKRSMEAATIAKKNNSQLKKVYSLIGGIPAWINNKEIPV